MASYLYRNSPVPTSEKTFTFSTWLKMSDASTSADNGIVEWYKSSNERYQILIDSTTRQLRLYAVESGTVKINIYTDMAFRDVNAWYHIVIHSDNTQASASDRFKLWVNGVSQTFSTYTWSFSQGVNINVFDGSSTRLNLGTRGEAYATWLNGYLADTYYIDGSLIDYTQFGETDSTTGEWKPKLDPTISSFGNAGIHLKYENSSNIGLDSSGNTNNFTASGTITQTQDNPSSVFATLNPLSANCTLSNGNTTWAGTTSGYEHSSATLGVSSGKYYWEVKPTNACGAMGITDFNWQAQKIGSVIYASSGYAWVYEGNGYVSHDSYGDISSSYSSYGSSDIIGVALDLDNNKLYFHKNGTYENSGDPTSGATGTGAISIDAPSSLPSGFYSPLVADLCGASAGGGSVNFCN